MIKNCSLNRTLLIFIASIWSSFLLAKEPSLTIFTENFPPYNYEDNGRITGINAELTSLMCEAADIRCELKMYPWTRAFNLTRSTINSGLVSTSRSPSRENLFNWVGPLASDKTFLYKLKSREDIQASTIEDATKYSVGIQRNDIYTSVLADLGFKMASNVMNFSYKNDEIDLFLAGKIDLIVSSNLTLRYALQGKEKSSESVVPLIELPVDQLSGNFLAMNKETDAALVKRLQKALDELKHSGRFNELVTQFTEQ